MASGPPSPLLGRQVVHALKALMELAEDSPPRWRSVTALAAQQGGGGPVGHQPGRRPRVNRSSTCSRV